MKPGRGLTVRFVVLVVVVLLLPELEPAIVESVGAREGSGKVNGDDDAADELGGGDAAGLAHAAVVDGDGEGEGLAGEAAECGGVEVEAGGGGGGVRRRRRR